MDKVGGSIATKTVNTPWQHVSASRTRSWGMVEATLTGTATSRTWTALEGGQWRQTIWDERNLAIVQSTSASPELRRALADRYGVNNAAIWLRTEEDWVSTTGQRSAGTASTSMATDSRQNDIGKLNGNSHFTSLNGDGTQSNCTTAFAWGTETDNLFMTAGHCVDAKSFTFGDVVWTNWKKGVGTVGLPGDTTTYGDLALQSGSPAREPESRHHRDVLRPRRHHHQALGHRS
ncbi:hypothetical protein [Nonomuraea angiospora]